MASLQRIALYVLFDSIENDLVDLARRIPEQGFRLTDDERRKAKIIVSKRNDQINELSDIELVQGLDLGVKFEILLRHKPYLSDSIISYLLSMREAFFRAVVVRNAVMHGRPLTTDEYALGFAFAQALLSNKEIWNRLHRTYIEYTKSPESIARHSITLLDEPPSFGVLHNLPSPDYDDTGFVKRSTLEKSLKNRILGRYPVITVLGDGGNGKTALTLQTLWNLVESNDHDFDMIHWFSAKTATLTPTGVEEISGAVVNSGMIVENLATFEPGSASAIERIRKLVADNKILLVIDNLETVTGGALKELIEDVPGDSKVVVTSRVPVGGDLPIPVPEFSDDESEKFLRTLIDVYALSGKIQTNRESLARYSTRLGNKPLLLKWFALGVKSGLDPERILSNPEIALRFCLENVVDSLSKQSKILLGVFNSIPEPLSPAVISEISRLITNEVEDSAAELSRFGLIEVKEVNSFERNFRLRPFVRSYVTRIIGIDEADRDLYRRNYQSIQISFEKKKASASFNRYDAKMYTVRTKSEAVTTNHIIRLSYLLSQGEDEIVEEKIKELRLVNPGYFEIYRFEAYASFTWGDIPRAIECYNASIEYGSDQPQLYFFFGGMLMRAGYPAEASEQFEKVLSLDPDDPIVLREYARNLLRLGDFEKADELLCKAEKLDLRTLKEIVLLIDMRVQYYQRYIDYLIINGAQHDADKECINFLEFLENSNTKLFDETIVQHVLKIQPSLRELRNFDRISCDGARRLSEWLFSNFSNGIEEFDHLVGSLKTKGRRDTFGFLVDRSGGETFLPAANVRPEVWAWLQNEGAVTFRVREKADGRREAFDVEVFRL